MVITIPSTTLNLTDSPPFFKILPHYPRENGGYEAFERVPCRKLCCLTEWGQWGQVFVLIHEHDARGLVTIEMIFIGNDGRIR